MKPDKRAVKTSAPAVTPLWNRPVIQRYLPVVAVLFVVFLAYSNSFHAPLLMDSDEIILKDSRVHSASGFELHRILTQQYWQTATTGLYRPLTTLSYLFNYTILGDGPGPEGYHWLNFLLHALNIVMVYALGLAVFETIPPAIALSALWGLHPVLTEAVTNVVGRADLLAAACVLGALLCHRQALRKTGASRFAWVAAVGLIVAAGMFSKESAVVTVAVLVFHDLAFDRTSRWSSRIPSYVAATIPALLYLYVRSRVMAGVAYTGTQFGDNPLLAANFVTARITALKVIGKYFGLLLWPAQLSYDYSYNEIPLFGSGASGWENAKAAIGALLCVCALVAAIRAYRRQPAVFFAIAFFFAAISPVSNLAIVIGAIMGERFLYLPAVGIAILAVWVWQIYAARPKSRNAALAAAGIVLFALACRTYIRNGDWVDQQRLWRSGIEAAPGSYKTHLNFTSSTFLTAQEWDRPIVEANRVLEILAPLPDSENAPNAYRDVAVLYRILGEKVAAKQIAGTILTGTTPDFWYRKALDALLRSERIELAWDERYRRENQKAGITGITSLPAKLYLELGRVYMRLDDPRRALPMLERGRALESDPDLLEELGAAYKSTGDLHSAALVYVEALAMDSRRGQIGSTLVELYGKLDPTGCSITREGGEPGLNVNCPLVHNDICSASKNVAGNYSRRGQSTEAAAIRRTAVQELGCTPGSVN